MPDPETIPIIVSGGIRVVVSEIATIKFIKNLDLNDYVFILKSGKEIVVPDKNSDLGSQIDYYFG